VQLQDRFVFVGLAPQNFGGLQSEEFSSSGKGDGGNINQCDQIWRNFAFWAIFLALGGISNCYMYISPND
jgi:hypothetical protein